MKLFSPYPKWPSEVLPDQAAKWNERGKIRKIERLVIRKYCDQPLSPSPLLLRRRHHLHPHRPVVQDIVLLSPAGVDLVLVLIADQVVGAFGDVQRRPV